MPDLDEGFRMLRCSVKRALSICIKSIAFLRKREKLELSESHRGHVAKERKKNFFWLPFAVIFCVSSAELK